jgi:hypothetical protein
MAEDVEDTIYRVATEETPFTSMIGKTSVSAVFHEWLTEDLATPVSTNAQLEGDDYTAAAANQPTRVGNYCQISAKAFTISRTADIIRKYGRDTETARHKVIRGLELRRDIEMRAIGNYASVNESGATTRKSAGALAWLTSNDSRGASGSDGGFSSGVVSAATNGTQRALTETLLKTVMSNLFGSRGGSGGRNYAAFMSGTHKQQMAAFTGISALRTETGKGLAEIVGGAEVYWSDFGKITMHPHPYGLTRDLFVAALDMWAIGTLDGMKTKELGATGDATKWLMTKEWTLVSRNQKASAVIADLT